MTRMLLVVGGMERSFGRSRRTREVGGCFFFVFFVFCFYYLCVCVWYAIDVGAD